VSVDDIISKEMWTKLFLEGQGYKITENLIYCDDQSSMRPMARPVLANALDILTSSISSLQI
jgi:hypothetical protein